MPAIDEIDDIQAIVDRGFGSLTGATNLLLRIVSPASVREWLRTLPVTSLGQAKASKLERVCHVAFTAAGLAALGFDPVEVGGFAPEFLDGMAGSERKSAQLGDIGSNSPSNWCWGLGASEPHILVMLISSPDEIARLEEEMITASTKAGCELIQAGRTNGVLGREPFGFADGLSQPEPDWEGKLTPGTSNDRNYRNSIAAGEFILGHPNEYGFVADYPSVNEVGRNGSYLVYRQLAQDVRGLWTWLADKVGTLEALALAEKMVGRRLDGDPLACPAVGPNGNFTFNGDADGTVSSIGAHIRRANPRSGDDPGGNRGFISNLVSTLGLKGTAIHDAVASARFHRILRRGRAYGPTLDLHDAMTSPRPADEAEAGLHFICLGASLARQFEFVQSAWVASAYFAGGSCEQDPIVGNRVPDNGGRATDCFAYFDNRGCPRIVSGIPQFVTVRGGAYFFLPGLKGLAFILAG